MTGLVAGALSVLIIVLPGPTSPAAPQDPTPPVAVEQTPPTGSPTSTGPLPDVGHAVGGVADSVNGLAHGADLTGWKLTIPVKNEKGTASTVNNPGAGAAPWMTTGQDGSLKFWAPVDGATTPNSQHTRTELDSLHNFTAGTGQHTLHASVSVEQVPSSKQDIIIGQIHGADTISSVSFVMLHYTAGAIRAVVKQGQSGPTSTKYPLISGVPLGGRFDYTISDPGDGTVVCTATSGSTSRSATIPIPAAFKGATVRFQAGDYQQADSTGADTSSAAADAHTGGQDGGRVTFFSLTEDHPGGTS
jgi:hypothetical protein